MIFRLSLFTALFVGVIMGISPLARAQSAGGGESIVSSTPDGQTVSNALLPNAQAPQPQEQSEMPRTEASISFDQSMPGPILPRPESVYIPGNNDRDSSDPRKQMGVKTAEEMMGVPTLQDIFGLSKSDLSTFGATSQTNTSLFSSSTNRYSSDSMNDGDANWSKILISGEGNDTFNTARATNNSNSSGGMFGRMFDNDSSDSAFGGQKKDSEEDSIFTSTFSDQPQSDMPSSSPYDNTPPPQPAMQVQTSDLAPNNSALSSVFSSSLSSPSPFAVPQAMVPAAPTVPQVPQAPGFSSGNNYSLGQPVTPSWAPKPPPWLSSQPQMGTMVQRKF